MNVTSFTYDERKKIEKLYNANTPVPRIAEALGCNVVKVHRELKRGFTHALDKNERKGYSAKIGQETYDRNVRNRPTAFGA